MKKSKESSKLVGKGKRTLTVKVLMRLKQKQNIVVLKYKSIVIHKPGRIKIELEYSKVFY